MNAPLHHPLAAEPEPMRFSAEDFAAMVGAGLFADKVGKIELVDGIVMRMTATYNLHYAMQRWLMLAIHDRLLERTGSDLLVGIQPSVRFGERFVREPDVCVHGPFTPARAFLTADIVRLAIEVSDTTLAYDLGPKPHAYAAAGIPEYWVVDRGAKTVHLHAKPGPEGYDDRTSARFGETFASPILGDFSIAG